MVTVTEGFRHDSIPAAESFISELAPRMKKAEPIVRAAIDRLEALELSEDDIRRLVENELALRRTSRQTRRRRA